MGMILKKYPLYLGLFGGFFLTLQAFQGTLFQGTPFQGTFKKSLLKKPFNISMATHQFLKDILPLQRNVLSNVLHRSKKSSRPLQSLQNSIDSTSRILQSNVLMPEDAQQLYHQVVLLKNYVFEGDFASKVSQTYCDVDQNKLWNFLMQALPAMKLGGLERDRAYLLSLVAQIGCINSSPEKIKQHALIVRAVATGSDMLNHFDGLMVNDYDLIVLSHLMISMVLLEV